MMTITITKFNVMGHSIKIPYMMEIRIITLSIRTLRIKEPQHKKHTTLQ